MHALNEKEKELLNTEKSGNKLNKRKRMEAPQSVGFNIIKSSFDGLCKMFFKINTSKNLNYGVFLEGSKAELIQILSNEISEGGIKYNIILEATYVIPDTGFVENRAFKSLTRHLYLDNMFEESLDEDFLKVLLEEEEYMGKGSGFRLQSIDGLILNVYRFNPLMGSSYIKLPPFIANRNAVINVMNNDQKCFKYAILSKFNKSPHPERFNRFYNLDNNNRYNFSDLTFPLALSDVRKFEKQNNDVSINVYGVQKDDDKNKYKNKNNIIIPLKVCDHELRDHFDLLLIGDSNADKHYCYISNFSRLIRGQLTSHTEQMVLCKRCFKGYTSTDKYLRLIKHKLFCNSNELLTPIMPNSNSILKFENWGNTQKHPIAIFGDFECLLKNPSLPSQRGAKTKITHTHQPMSYCFYVSASKDVPLELLNKFEIPQLPVLYRGDKDSGEEDVAKRFVDDIIDTGEKIEKMLSTYVPIIFTENNEINHERVTHQGSCPVCSIHFSINNPPVKHHNHLSGCYIQTVCNSCNLKLKTPTFVPCYFHNLSNYDAHFIVKQLGFDTKSIAVIPNTEEKYISFSKYITNRFRIKFIDTFKFMSTSLEKLSKNLSYDKSKFRETKRVFTEDDMEFVMQKGLFPYEYCNNWDKLEEKELPPMSEFYSSLKEEHITEKEYDRAKRVWRHFKFENLGQYSDWYLKVDVMLLVDVFQNFRDLCMTTYGLDPCYYLTAPGMAFDCMFKHTKVELELLEDYDKLLMIEHGIRGGLTQAVRRYSKSNNYTVPEYNNNEPDSWIVYLDATNL